jgi:hypothetical protein
MSATLNNYGGKQPSNTQNVKQFYTGTASSVWIAKKMGTNSDGTNKMVIVPTLVADVLVQKDLIVEGSILNPSDLTLKKNIQNVSDNEILCLNPVEFNFKSDKTQKKHFGFIAQDMEKIFPDLVSTNKIGYKTVNYIELIPLMLSKMQKMQDEINSLKEKLSEICKE